MPMIKVVVKPNDDVKNAHRFRIASDFSGQVMLEIDDDTLNRIARTRQLIVETKPLYPGDEGY